MSGASSKKVLMLLQKHFSGRYGMRRELSLQSKSYLASMGSVGGHPTSSGGVSQAVQCSPSKVHSAGIKGNLLCSPAGQQIKSNLQPKMQFRCCHLATTNAGINFQQRSIAHSTNSSVNIEMLYIAVLRELLVNSTHRTSWECDETWTSDFLISLMNTQLKTLCWIYSFKVKISLNGPGTLAMYLYEADFWCSSSKKHSLIIAPIYPNLDQSSGLLEAQEQEQDLYKDLKLFLKPFKSTW